MRDRRSSTDRPETPRRWGSHRDLGFWLSSLFVLPLLLCGLTVLGGVVGMLLGVLLAAPIADERLAHASLHGLSGDLFAYTGLVGVALGAIVALAWWASRAPMTVRVEDDRVVAWRLFTRTSIQLDDVVRAFVTVPPHEPSTSNKLILHLTTRYRDLAIPLRRVTTDTSWTERRQTFEGLIEEVTAALARRGKHVEAGVPTSWVTDADHPVGWALFWPHRRVLAHRWARLDREGGGPVDHRRPQPSLRLAWLLRPAPIAFTLFTLAVVAAVRWYTEAPQAPTLLAGVGVLTALLLPAWNGLKSLAHRLRTFGHLTPESLIGHDLIDDLPARLKPAPGCLVDLEASAVRRPDGVEIGFDAIERVEYGPASGPGTPPAPIDALQRAIASTSWRLAVTPRGEASRPVEIYGNASVDIVRYGDLDAGYATFNWVTARQIALGAGANLVLATGRVGRSAVGRPLALRLLDDVTRYDPEPVRRRMAERQERCRVHVVADDERFAVWGPLTRQPELCATPPVYRPLLMIAAIGLMALAFPPAGLLAGYLLATLVGDVITAAHFARPGFALDRDGVWVRGKNIPWGELEESTLMPIAPGPILFCGPRRVLVAGHIGGSYHERAWLGCAAYDWIRRHVGEEAL